MRTFCNKHESKINGVLSCFDRMLFRGYLPLMSGAAMAQFLMSEKVRCDNLKTFLIDNAERVKAHAQEMAASAGRPYIYLASAGMKMERHARELVESDEISEGLVCIFAKLEPCKSFSFKYHKTYPFVNAAKRKCLHIYYYFMDREFGLVHVQIQTWFPLRMQVFVNGHDWLARKLDAAKIKYTQCDNVFVAGGGCEASTKALRSDVFTRLAVGAQPLCSQSESLDGVVDHRYAVLLGDGTV